MPEPCRTAAAWFMTPCRRLPLAFISESIRIRLHFFHSLPHPIGRISYWSVFLVRSPRSLGRMLIRRGGEDGGTPKNSCVACFRSTIELGFARVTSRLFSLRGFHFRLISFHPGRDSVFLRSIKGGDILDRWNSNGRGRRKILSRLSRSGRRRAEISLRK